MSGPIDFRRRLRRTSQKGECEMRRVHTGVTGCDSVAISDQAP